MWTIVIGIVVNLFVSYEAYSSLLELQQLELPVAIADISLYVLAFFWLLSVAGLVLILTGRKKAGAIMVIVGSVITVPIGLIAIIGARNVIKSLGNDLDARRKLAPRGGATPPSV
ncbi:hypothetical protein [Paraburkholderia sp.]|uniref:hypothetical protein n=1 Tax=Paraburkholderia sp. TaxID=1926495 RepID=UPI003D6DC34A